MAITLPAILLLYDWFYLGRKNIKIVWNKIPLGLVSLLFIFISITFLDTSARGPLNLNYSGFDRFCVPFYGLFFYAYK
ncbi:MAG TPA: hypothetical protein VNX68_03765, partial [Nitrosopumilaceae archaeon]|nr:hypothetical protein [Nitrosopumilaceae archaeon]